MELRHLRYFCIAAEEMHIHRAAERLGIAQPPLTQQIKALEAELGLKLFARAGRGVALTEAGRLFHAEAKSILEHVERATILARQVANGHVGRLRVGFTESASFSPVFTGHSRRSARNGRVSSSSWRRRIPKRRSNDCGKDDWMLASSVHPSQPAARSNSKRWRAIR
jgi:DNA-binding transcriptional LysR family regulator